MTLYAVRLEEEADWTRADNTVFRRTDTTRHTVVAIDAENAIVKVRADYLTGNRGTSTIKSILSVLEVEVVNIP